MDYIVYMYSYMPLAKTSCIRQTLQRTDDSLLANIQRLKTMMINTLHDTASRSCYGDSLVTYM